MMLFRLAHSRIVVQATGYTRRLVARIEHTNRRNPEYGLLAPETIRSLQEVAR